MDYGLEGYGLYFYCLELIAANVEKHNLTFELEHDARIIARNTGSTVEKVQQMMGRFIELKLFENTNGVVTCLKMLTRTDEYTQKLIKKEIDNGNNNLERIPTMSRQCPDSVGIKSVLIEENRIEENKNLSPPAPTFNFKNSLVDCGVEQKNIIAWMAVRKKKKAVNSEVAFDGFLREVEISGLSYNQAVQMSAENSWSGFKAEWANKDRGKSNGTYQTANEKAADRMRHTRDYATATNF